MKIYEEFIRAHLPKELADRPIIGFDYYFLDGLNIMTDDERGGDDILVYKAKSEEDLILWQYSQVCKFIGDWPEFDKRMGYPKKWRYYRAYAKNNKWKYIEYTKYDYNAIEDSRLKGFEKYLALLKYGFPPERWEKEVKGYIALMNYWYSKPHWDYDRKKLCFIEISDTKEHDEHSNPIDEPRPGSVIKVVEGYYSYNKFAEIEKEPQEEDSRGSREITGNAHKIISEIFKETRAEKNNNFDISAIKKTYQTAKVNLYLKAEKFISQYAYLFSSKEWPISCKNSEIDFFFNFYDSKDEKTNQVELLQKAVFDTALPFTGYNFSKVYLKIREKALCNITPVGLFGFAKPSTLYVGENGKFYATKNDINDIRVYDNILDMLEYELKVVISDEITALPQKGNNKAKIENIWILKDIALEMIYCPKGSFRMGSPKKREEYPHEVKLTKPFYIGKYPVTQMQYYAIMKKQPSYFKGEDRPVESVSWDDAKEFVENINFLYKRQLPQGYKFALPSEAQWEYACRAGTTSDLNNGRNIISGTGKSESLDEVAFYSQNSDDRTHTVGKKKPNNWGIYDMHGNVCEWCEDSYDYYPESDATDPTGPESGSYHVLRGGSYLSNPGSCRSASRYYNYHDDKQKFMGFRLAMIKE
jgi:formylglycine-generating enzyme required for sulfatase activity